MRIRQYAKYYQNVPDSLSIMGIFIFFTFLRLGLTCINKSEISHVHWINLVDTYQYTKIMLNIQLV